MTVNRPTPRAVQQALDLLARLAQPTERELAEARLRHAKALMSEAAAAVLGNDPRAATLGDEAHTELEAARQALARIGDR